MSRKCLLILGANSDIAKACAIEFHNHGYELILASRNVAELNAFIEKERINAEIKEFDALNFDSHSSFYNNLKTKPETVMCAFGYLGDKQLSLNNFMETQKVLDTNLSGAISILNVIANDFKLRGYGNIIGISSVAANRGRGSNVIYCASKAGFDSYLSGLRNLLSQSNIDVLTVKPGFVRTKMLQNQKTPDLLTENPEKLAKKIYNASSKKRNIIYSNGKWRILMAVIGIIPERIFKKLNL